MTFFERILFAPCCVSLRCPPNRRYRSILHPLTTDQRQLKVRLLCSGRIWNNNHRGVTYLPDPSKDIRLPTYDQSEKYEKDGVLEYASDYSSCDEVITVRSATNGLSEQGSEEELPMFNRGTLCEFMIFFIGMGMVTSSPPPPKHTHTRT